jgi:hypothetical protein
MKAIKTIGKSVFLGFIFFLGITKASATCDITIDVLSTSDVELYNPGRIQLLLRIPPLPYCPHSM